MGTPSRVSKYSKVGHVLDETGRRVGDTRVVVIVAAAGGSLDGRRRRGLNTHGTHHAVEEPRKMEAFVAPLFGGKVSVISFLATTS